MFFKKKKKPSQKIKETLQVCDRIIEKQISYITERDNTTYVENLLGKEGGFCIVENELVLHCNAHEEFRARLGEVSVGELMSGDGAVIRGFDTIQGKERSIVIYFKYYRGV